MERGFAPPLVNVVFFGPAAIAGNLIILLAFWRNKQLAKEEALYALLALTDFLSGVTQTSAGAHHYLLSSSAGTTSRLQCLLVEVAPMLMMLVCSRLALCSIAVDRVRALRNPVAAINASWLTRRRILIRSAASVSVGFGLMSFTYLGGFALNVAQGNWSVMEQIVCHPTKITHFPFDRLSLLLIVLSVVAVLVSNVVVVVYVRKALLRRRQLNVSSTAANAIKRSVNSCYVLLLITFIFLLNSFLPYFFLFLLIAAAGNPANYPALHFVIVLLIKSSNGLNASINIVVYTLKHKAIRKAVIGLFRRNNNAAIVIPLNQLQK